MDADVDLVKALIELTTANVGYDGSEDAFIMNDFLQFYVCSRLVAEGCMEGVPVPKCSGNAVLELGPHDPLRVVGEGNS